MSDHIRGTRLIREVPYLYLMARHEYEAAAKIAESNLNWYEAEAQRWALLFGESFLAANVKRRIV